VKRADKRPPTLADGQIGGGDTGRRWNRRHVLGVGVGLVSGLMAVAWPRIATIRGKWQGHSPRFRQKRPAVSALSTGRTEGFYIARPKSNLSINTRFVPRPSVIQYIDFQGRMLFARSSRVDRLDVARPEEVSFETALAHVNFQRASAIFEIAALERIRRKQYDESCQLLIAGIRHDLTFKASGRDPLSLRLFDLLAIVSLRTDQKQHFDALQRIASESSDFGREQLSDRLSKWTDAGGRWRRRMLDPKKRVTWGVMWPANTSHKKDGPRLEIPRPE
jgi:hypothetical protein